MIGRRSVALALPIIAVAAAAATLPAHGGTAAAHARTRAYGIQVQLPNQQPIVAGLHEAPPSASGADGSFSYPDDGSLVSARTLAGRGALLGAGATARAGSDVTGLSLFGGEITADAVVARVTANASGSVDFTGSSLTNLVVLGEPVTAQPHLRVPLADWGHAIVLEEEVQPARASSAERRGWLTALDVWLDASHDGLPPGTRILVGYADATATMPPSTAPPSTAPPASPPEQAPLPAPALPPLPVLPAPAPPPVAPPPLAPRRAVHVVSPRHQAAIAHTRFSPAPVVPVTLRPAITARGYVFPVYGPSGYGDSFAAPRSDVHGGWHHGDDIFAPLGAPVLAVADGTVFSVGPNPIGGNRLWLQDESGNQFYYAHLSAYTPLARDGARVHAGDVLGFVGNTGDAEGGPYHLHFEIHPAGLLFLGYDGVVDPTPYLDAWRHVRDIRFPAGLAWAPQPLRTHLPPAGALLLQSTDISTATGLDPRSLERVLQAGGTAGS